VGVAQFAGAIAGTFIANCGFGFKTILTVAQFLMGTFLILVAVFDLIN
jgi:hypothetical protein